VAPKIAERNGGYTRIIRTGYRLGDNAEMCLIELVDFNELYSNEGLKKTTRRSRRGGVKKSDSDQPIENVSDETSSEEVVEDAVVVDEVASSEDSAEVVTENENSSNEEIPSESDSTQSDDTTEDSTEEEKKEE
jgi:large subunit ribosomal protein L17